MLPGRQREIGVRCIVWVMLDRFLKPGERLQDRYLIVQPLRLSGLAALYEARDTHAPIINQQRVLKEAALDHHIWPDPAGSPRQLSAAEAFAVRAGLLKSLNHPVLAKTYDGFIEGRNTYTVMEYVRGRDLEDILTDSRHELPVEAVLQWAIDLCDALDYLHSHEMGVIVFRDVKPSNIMIDQRLRARLVDSGIAGVFPSRRTDHPLGTDGYASPEQYEGVVTPAIDIYGLGATLHHLLTRHDPRLEPPFTFEERSISRLNPRVPIKLESIIVRALSRNPQFRFSTAAHMRESLRALQEE